MMGGKNVCPDFLLPEDEGFWPNAFKILLEGFQSSKGEEVVGKGNMFGRMADLCFHEGGQAARIFPSAGGGSGVRTLGFLFRISV